MSVVSVACTELPPSPTNFMYLSPYLLSAVLNPSKIISVSIDDVVHPSSCNSHSQRLHIHYNIYF